MKRRKTKITVEAERLLVISRHQAIPSWCDECGRTVERLGPEQAATVAGVTPRTIYRWVEADQLHFSETPEGWLRICLDSLVRERQN